MTQQKEPIKKPKQKPDTKPDWGGKCEVCEAYAQSLKQAAPPQAESPKDEVDYNECCCEDGYKMICPQHGAPQTLAVGHGVEMADDCAHRALDRLGVPRDGKGLYLRMQWLKDQIPKRR